MLDGRRIVLAVSGGIAAYKAADLCSRLLKEGAQVRVAMTDSATRFVSPLTFETLSHAPVYQSVFDAARSFDMEHISWSKWADVLIIAPATANTIAKMAHGLADDAVSTLYLAFTGPVVVAPAMNANMWQHPATSENLRTLVQRGVHIVDPEKGALACGDVGPGRLADPCRIIEYLKQLPLRARDGAGSSDVSEAQPSLLENDDTLMGKTVLITSGPTHEYLDPVRFLTNPSSGKMGAALAREAARRGAKVHLVTGPVSPTSIPSDCANVHKVTTAEQMLKAVQSLAPEVDLFIFAAAVSDFRVASPPARKIKRTGNSLSLPLVENPDIAQLVGMSKRDNQVTVGFAAETNDMEANALGKMERKRLDAIVANDVADPRIGFDRDENEVTVYMRTGQSVPVSRRPKPEVAREILTLVLPLLSPAR